MEKLGQNKILAIVIAAVVLVLILAECQAESLHRNKNGAESGGISETFESDADESDVESDESMTTAGDTDGATEADETAESTDEAADADESGDVTDADNNAESD